METNVRSVANSFQELFHSRHFVRTNCFLFPFQWSSGGGKKIVKMRPTVLTRIVLLHAVIFYKILIVVGQSDDYYSNYDNNYPNYDEGPKFDSCHFYDDDHEANGNCFHKSLLEVDEIDNNLRCCDGHKYIFYDQCEKRKNNGKLMCGDPSLSRMDPVNLSHNLICPQHCKPKLLNQGNYRHQLFYAHLGPKFPRNLLQRGFTESEYLHCY